VEEGGWRKMKKNNVRGKRIQENVCEKVDKMNAG